mmetsp:Transcript_27682/g.38485  ORF Transcript_27682/g.38485 Transcript_27682/m.38485 type:complete len:190 (-) Transcript_27682:136-705(-)
MDLTHVGKHCALKECSQLDFLPFRCSHCSSSFCLEHRKPEDHSCSKYTPPRPPVVTICKDCNRSITANGDDSMSSLLEKHYKAGECKKFKVTKPFRCTYLKPSGKVCRKREFDENICKHCSKNYCIKHRHAEEHECSKLEKKKIGRTVSARKSPGPSSSCSSQARRGRGSGTNVAHSRLVKMFQSAKVN